jgi:anti-anti-sigma regulatory factor
VGEHRDIAATVLLVADADGHEEVIARVEATMVDLGLVDALARLQCRARRAGKQVRIRDASPALRGLLELVGLAGVLAVEPLGQPERREQLGVEEVVEPGDPPG